MFSGEQLPAELCDARLLRLPAARAEIEVRSSDVFSATRARPAHRRLRDVSREQRRCAGPATMPTRARPTRRPARQSWPSGRTATPGGRPRGRQRADLGPCRRVATGLVARRRTGRAGGRDYAPEAGLSRRPARRTRERTVPAGTRALVVAPTAQDDPAPVGAATEHPWLWTGFAALVIGLVAGWPGLVVRGDVRRRRSPSAAGSPTCARPCSRAPWSPRRSSTGPAVGR